MTRSIGSDIRQDSRSGRGSGFNLSALSSLKRIRLDFDAPSSSSRLLRRILEELARLTTDPERSLIELELCISADRIDELHDWDALLLSHSRGRGRSLEEITLRVKDHVEEEDIRMYMEPFEEADVSRCVREDEKEVVISRMPCLWNDGILKL